MTDTITARFNFTGRQRIEIDKAKVSIETENGRLLAVLTILDPDFFSGFDPKARVVVGLKRRTAAERIDFGPVSGLVSPILHPIELFTDPVGVKATIKVVSTSSDSRGLLLGASTALDASNADESDDAPLLLFQRFELGNEVWRLDFADQTPTVLINSAIEDWEGEVRDVRFQALVFPEITRRVAEWLATEIDEGDETSGMAANWRRFFTMIGAPMTGLDQTDPSAVAEWTSECAAALAARQTYLLKYLGSTEDDQ